MKPKTTNTKSRENLFIWLSGSDPDLLDECPRWEKIKHGAFGASVLVPMSFGTLAAAYAISTITDLWYVIVSIALLWGFIILTIDRVLLSTYRSFASRSAKRTQFLLRISVALLMGATISHPLTLLLFKDTIASEIEKKRGQEIAVIRKEAETKRLSLDQRVLERTRLLADHQKKYQETIGGAFLAETPVSKSSEPESYESLDPLDEQIEELKAERARVRSDLEKWQETYDLEIRGVRSGQSGVGPNARAIEKDHLAWRREETLRLNNAIAKIFGRRNELSSELIASTMKARAGIDSKRVELEEQKLDLFASEQNGMLAVIKQQIDSVSHELDRLRAEHEQQIRSTEKEIEAVQSENRTDLLIQTLALHDLFRKPDGGGLFALAVYLVLAGLFTVIDTIPLVVKFLSVPGIYDRRLSYREGLEFDDEFAAGMMHRDDVVHGVLHYQPKSIVKRKEGSPVKKVESAQAPSEPVELPQEDIHVNEYAEAPSPSPQISPLKKTAPVIWSRPARKAHSFKAGEGDRNISVELEYAIDTSELAITKTS